MIENDRVDAATGSVPAAVPAVSEAAPVAAAALGEGASQKKSAAPRRRRSTKSAAAYDDAASSDVDAEAKPAAPRAQKRATRASAAKRAEDPSAADVAPAAQASAESSAPDAEKPTKPKTRRRTKAQADVSADAAQPAAAAASPETSVPASPAPAAPAAPAASAAPAAPAGSDAAPADAEPPRRRRGRPSKREVAAREAAAREAALAQGVQPAAEAQPAPVAAPAEDRGASDAKAQTSDRPAPEAAASSSAEGERAESPEASRPARPGRGRRRRMSEANSEVPSSDASSEAQAAAAASEPASDASPREAQSPAAQAGGPGSDAPGSGSSASEGAASDAPTAEGREGAEPGDGYVSRRRRHERRQDRNKDRYQDRRQSGGQDGRPSDQQPKQSDEASRSEREGAKDGYKDGYKDGGKDGYKDGYKKGPRDARQRGEGFVPRSQKGQYAQGSVQKQNKRDVHGRQRDFTAEPKTNREELEELKVGDLRTKATELGLEAAGLKKGELVDAVYAAMVKAEGFSDFQGVLELNRDGGGSVRTRGYLASEHDVVVSAYQVRTLGLRRGDSIEGVAFKSRPFVKGASACKFVSINGRAPEEAKSRPRFGDLTPVFPTEPLKMEHGRDSILGRCIDLVAPIGKGQRGLIVSPPKAGKTTVLKKIAESIAANNPEVHLICLLVDERPEEVTDMQRSIKGEVVASTFDMPCDNHIAVSELVIERAKRLVEQGDDVVILLDSITRLARAYNLAQPASGRILSGGVDSTALYPPKRFLGAARNIEGGGSLTILASALVDTGSKMDEVIFEEFKGTGNMELKLDRDLADRRIFPAVDPISSGTRKEELLLDAGIAPLVWGLRRVLATMNSNERAMSSLIKGLRETSSNEEFLILSAKKAASRGDLRQDF